MVLDVGGETAPEFGNILLLDGKAHSIGVAAEGLKQVTARLDGRVDIKTAHRA